MRHSTTWVGLLGGFIIALVMVAPMYVDTPSRYLSTWHYVPRQLAMAANVGVLLLPAVVGALAAAFSPREPIRAGLQAGSLAMWLATAWMALPAEGVKAGGQMLTLMITGTPDPSELEAMLGTATLALSVGTTWTALGALVLGGSFGAMGGVTFDLTRGVAHRGSAVVRSSPVTLLGLITAAFLFPAVAAGLVQLDAMAPDWLSRTKLYAPMIAIGFAASILVHRIVYEAVLSWRSGDRGPAAAKLLVLPIIGITAFVLTAGLATPILLSPSFWIGVLLTLGGFVVGVVSGGVTESEIESTRSEFLDIVGDGIWYAAFLVGLVMTCGGSLAISMATLLAPYEASLQLGTPAAAAELVTWTFRWHWLTVLLIGVVAVGYQCIALPVWGATGFLKKGAGSDG